MFPQYHEIKLFQCVTFIGLSILILTTVTNSNDKTNLILHNISSPRKEEAFSLNIQKTLQTQYTRTSTAISVY